MFFFGKNKPKTSVSCARAGAEERDSEIKVFCFFFAKKKSFLLP